MQAGQGLLRAASPRPLPLTVASSSRTPALPVPAATTPVPHESATTMTLALPGEASRLVELPEAAANMLSDTEKLLVQQILNNPEKLNPQGQPGFQVKSVPDNDARFAAFEFKVSIDNNSTVLVKFLVNRNRNIEWFSAGPDPALEFRSEPHRSNDDWFNVIPKPRSSNDRTVIDRFRTDVNQGLMRLPPQDLQGATPLTGLRSPGVAALLRSMASRGGSMRTLVTGQLQQRGETLASAGALSRENQQAVLNAIAAQHGGNLPFTLDDLRWLPKAKVEVMIQALGHDKKYTGAMHNFLSEVLKHSAPENAYRPWGEFTAGTLINSEKFTPPDPAMLWILQRFRHVSGSIGS